MPESVQVLMVTPEAARQRMDAWLARHTALSRSRIQALIADGLVRCDGVPVPDPSHKVREGMRLEIREPPPAPVETLPQDIPLHILYEDSALLVLDKPAGRVVHPAPGHADGTLVNALLHHCRDLAGIGGERRPGIVHRLDRDTTGILVVAKTESALQGLQGQFQNGSVQKTYQALLHGIPDPPQGRIETLIARSPRDRKRMAVVVRGGRRAVSFFHTLETFPGSNAAYAEIRIETGRTHQIRVHLRHLGHPILGDPVYGSPKRDREIGLPLRRQLLHACRLSFHHPKTHEAMGFEAPLPGDFRQALEVLRQRETGH